MNFTKDDIVVALKTVYDPEIPVNVYDLGLIYDIEIGGRVNIKMTLTSPTCPMAEEIMQMVRQAGESVAGVDNVDVGLVWDPPWSLDKMSQTARIELDLTDDGW